MAIPPTPGVFLAQAIWGGPSGLPEDVYVNTFAFRDPGAGLNNEIAHPQIVGHLSEFYRDPSVSGTTPLRVRYPSNLSPLRIKTYDLGQAAPREPLETVTTISGGAAPAGALPSEVSVVCSFYADRNLPRQRGRIYLGPLVDTVVSDATEFKMATVLQPFRVDIRNAAKRLAENSGAAVLPWAVFSRVDGVARDVTAGWVDDAFDTQRRRGEPASVRETWERA